MEMTLPEPHAGGVLLLTVFALFLFTRDRIALETSSLLVLTILAIGFELFPYETPLGFVRPIDFFSGFGHQALVAVCALMVAGHGLVRTGALERIGRLLSRSWNKAPALSFLLTLIIAASLSAFINNTPIVVLLLPILVSVSLRAKRSTSAMLMPMGFATLLGGTSTTIGTSTNLLVVSVAADLGLRNIGMFDFFVPAAIAGAVGIVYLWLIAPRLLPDNPPLIEDSEPKIFSGQLHITEGSFGDGKTLSELILKTGSQLKVDNIIRTEYTRVLPLPDVVILAGDRLMVHDTPQNLKELEEILGASLYTEKSDNGTSTGELGLQDQQLAEVIVNRESPLRTRSLSEIGFAERYKLIIPAIHRGGKPIQKMRGGIENIRLRIGDVLLVQGHRDDIAQLKRSGLFLVLDNTTDLPHSSKASVALFIMSMIVLVSAFGLLPIALSAVAGALLMIIFGCLSWRDVGRAISAQVVLVIVTSLALGSALLQTGGSEFIATVFVSLTAGAPPYAIVSALVLLMAILTNVVSNNAAAVIGTPVAVSIASALGLDAEPFVLAVLFGANLSYVTPMSYQTNLLVMSAGGYKFGDFVRVGLPLALLMWAVYSILLMMIYKL